MNRHQFVGHDLRGELGKGGTHIKLANVNGRIEIHHAQDGRAMSPVKDLSQDDDDDSDIRMCGAGMRPPACAASPDECVGATCDGSQ